MHLLCWAIVIGYEVGAIYSVGGLSRSFAAYAIYYVINIGLFYALIYLNAGWSLATIARLVAIVVTYLLFKSTADFYLLPPGSQLKWLEVVKQYMARNIYRGAYFAVLAYFFLTAKAMFRYRERALKAQLAFLKQQTQPHLLFNALNFIYSSVEAHSEAGARCVWLLSDLMRFSLREPDSDGRIELETEVEQLRNLAEINAFRFGKMALDVQITENLNGRIIPLVLITLAENVFKHGDVQQPAEPALITLRSEGPHLFFETRNRKLPAIGNSTSLGLQNIRTRLSQAYGNNYTLQVEDDAVQFRVLLEVPL